MARTRTVSPFACRLDRHFVASAAACALAAVGVATRDADASIQRWVLNTPITADTNGLYINVETGAVASTAGSVLGWDLNPYGPTSLTFYNPSSSSSGTGVLRAAGATSGSAANLAPLTPIDAGGSYGTGSVVVGSAAGNWQLNAVNLFGFRFIASDGLVHFGWGRIQVGAAITERTLLDIAWESAPLTPILAGRESSGAPNYDPCSPGNPMLVAGANLLPLEQSTAADLDPRGSSCGFVIRKANLFRFTAAASGWYDIGTCASGADTRLAVLAGCAAGAQVLACNDNSCGQSAALSVQLAAGQTSFIAVGGVAPRSNLPSPLAITVTPQPEPACLSAPVLRFGANAFDNSSAGTAQPVRSSLGGSTATIHKAVWQRFTPAVTGAYSFSMCGSVGDSMIALSDTCPGIGARLESIAFNDDACACSAGCAGTYASALHAASPGIPLTQPLVAGQTYFLVVGSFAATSPVQATLVIDGPAQPPSNPADLTGDGHVTAQDISVLLSQWGQTGTADLDGNGVVGSSDIAILLNWWG